MFHVDINNNDAESGGKYELLLYCKYQEPFCLHQCKTFYTSELLLSSIQDAALRNSRSTVESGCVSVQFCIHSCNFRFIVYLNVPFQLL